MRHVGEEVGPVLVSDLSEAPVVQAARVAAHAGYDQLRLEQLSGLGQLVVVDKTVFGIHLIK